MYRHVRQNCKVAKENVPATPLADTADMKQQIQALMSMMAKLLEHNTAASASQTVNINTGNTVNHVNTANIVVAQQIVIQPWGGPKTMHVPSDMIAAAFTENPRLAEYCSLSESDKYDKDTAKSYILEALVELTKRAHKDPVYRNVYLNPNRADQAMVCIGDTKWEACPLNEVTRIMFESISSEIRVATSMYLAEKDRLPAGIEGSACYVPQLYANNPADYIDMAKGLIAAHLGNIAPVAPKKKRA